MNLSYDKCHLATVTIHEEGYTISIPGIMEPFYDTFHHQLIHCNDFIIYRALIQRHLASTTGDAFKVTSTSWDLVPDEFKEFFKDYTRMAIQRKIRVGTLDNINKMN